MDGGRLQRFVIYLWRISLILPLFLLIFLFSNSLYAFEPTICEKALVDLERSGPAVLPEAPPIPRRAPFVPRPSEPLPQPQRVEPKRREIPIPTPDQPGRSIPATPLVDPKDIQPEDLYSSDQKVAHFWNEMPLGLRRLMIEEMRVERAKLEAHMNQKYGGADARAILSATLALQAEIESIEARHTKDLLNIIGQMVERRYGPAIQNLVVRMTKELPLQARWVEENKMPIDSRMIPELPPSFDEGMIYRTEMRNLWLQGEGWVGMKEFAYMFDQELNAIHPGLAEKYQELDRLYRLGQLAQLDLIPMSEVVDQIPKEMISAGREIVLSDFEIVKRSDGSQAVRLTETKGVAVGRNAWAAAHEARKAASQMVTPSEGAYRWMMPEVRRQKLDEATNSARAEIRQGVFGPSVVQALKRRMSLIIAKAIEDQDYYQIIDGYFSLPPAIFIRLNTLLFDSKFESNPALQKEAQQILKEHGVLE